MDELNTSIDKLLNDKEINWKKIKSILQINTKDNEKSILTLAANRDLESEVFIKLILQSKGLGEKYPEIYDLYILRRDRSQANYIPRAISGKVLNELIQLDNECCRNKRPFEIAMRKVNVYSFGLDKDFLQFEPCIMTKTLNQILEKQITTNEELGKYLFDKSAAYNNALILNKAASSFEITSHLMKLIKSLDVQKSSDYSEILNNYISKRDRKALIRIESPIDLTVILELINRGAIINSEVINAMCKNATKDNRRTQHDKQIADELLEAAKNPGTCRENVINILEKAISDNNHSSASNKDLPPKSTESSVSVSNKPESDGERIYNSIISSSNPIDIQRLAKTPNNKELIIDYIKTLDTNKQRKICESFEDKGSNIYKFFATSHGLLATRKNAGSFAALKKIYNETISDSGDPGVQLNDRSKHRK